MDRPSVTDPGPLLREAEAHYGHGRPAQAKTLLEQVLRIAPGHPQSLHLLGLVLTDLGDTEAAKRSLESAARAAPHDPRIDVSLGNLLSGIGDHAGALSAYDRAIATDPRFAAARLYRAMTLGQLRRFAEARAEFTHIERIGALSIRVILARATLEHSAGEPGAAAQCLDMVLAHEPSNKVARIGRARLAHDLGEPDAADRYRAELARDPHDQQLIMGYIDAASGEEARADALGRLERAVAADPLWRGGQHTLARARREIGDASDYRAGYESLLATCPASADHWRDYIAIVAGTDAHGDSAALCARARAATGLAEFGVVQFGFLSAAGEIDAAEALLAQFGSHAIAPVALAKHRLRQRDAAAAEHLLARHIDAAPDDIEAWALRGIAWQLLGDPRFEWLNGQPGLIATLDLALDPTGIARIADRLRALHADSAERVGQSVRGGTQTLDNLFTRRDPVIHLLRDTIADGVSRYLSALPPFDPHHPILRHRNSAIDFSGAWSVRFTGAGFHVQHIHPSGILSAASYWAVPDPDPADPHAGWLEIGGAPAYLALDLKPYRTIEPRVGRLALFPSTLHHGTRAYTRGERMSVAFDLISTGAIPIPLRMS